MKKSIKYIIASLLISCFISISTPMSYAADTISTNLSNEPSTTKQSISKVKVPASKKVYKLVKVQKGVSDLYQDKMNQILDLLWNESNGKLILNTIARHNVEIKVIPKAKHAYTEEKAVSIAYSPSYIGMEDQYMVYYTNIIIPTNYIDGVLNKNLSTENRVSNLEEITRELAHAFMYVKNRGDIDSIKEEVGLSMVGYNIANHALTGQYLSKDMAHQYCEDAMVEIITNNTKKLPLKCNFSKSAPKFGLKLRNSDEYSDIQGLYNRMVDEGKIKPVSYIKVTK